MPINALNKNAPNVMARPDYGLPFEDRISNPQNYGAINNPDGSQSTHLMAAEIDENGQPYAFPMIVQKDGGLHKFDDPYEAMEWNKAHNNAKAFANINDALHYSKNYKTPEFNQYYDNQRNGLPQAPLTPEMQVKLGIYNQTQGRIDNVYDMVPGIGDVKAGVRAKDAAGIKLTPNLMGGATANIKDPYTFAFESATMVPLMGDLALAAKASIAAAGPLIARMSMRNQQLGKLAQALPYERGTIGIAKQADSLPMDEASRMARADDMFPTETYHGSTHDIKQFDATGANPESDWGPATYTSTSIDDINPNYAGEGPDLTSRIDQEADRVAYEILDGGEDILDEHGFSVGQYEADEEGIARIIARKRIKGGSEGVVYPLKINTEKYANIGGDTPTYIEMPDYRAEAMEEIKLADYADEWDYEDALQEYVSDLEATDMNHPIIEIRDELLNVANDDEVSDAISRISEEMYDGIDATRLDQIIRESISYPEGPNGEMLGSGAASARVFERLGYEGVIDNTVDLKFGSSRAAGKRMEGVYPDTVHIVTFPGFEKNIRSKFAKFDPAKKNSANLLAGGAAAAIGAGALMNRDEYVTKN